MRLTLRAGRCAETEACAIGDPNIFEISNPNLLPGEAVFLSMADVGWDWYQYTVHRLVGGVEQVGTLGSPMPFNDCTLNVPALSPDGGKVLTAIGGEERDRLIVGGASLYVTELLSGTTRLLLNDVRCTASIWSADSTRVR